MQWVVRGLSVSKACDGAVALWYDPKHEGAATKCARCLLLCLQLLLLLLLLHLLLLFHLLHLLLLLLLLLLLVQAASPDEEALVTGAAYLGIKLLGRPAGGG
jgi:hypothetical protein